MKPTYNKISGRGIKGVSLELDTIGYFARSMEDLELITDVLSIKPCTSPANKLLKDAKVGFVKTPFWSSSAGPGTIAAMEKAVKILGDHGVVVEDVEFPEEFNDAETLGRMSNVVFVSDAGTAFYEDYLMDDSKKLDPEIRSLVNNASELTREELRQAFDFCAALRPTLDKITTKYDVLLTPSATDEAPLGIDDMGSPAFNSLWTV